MDDIRSQKENIIARLKKVNESLTDEMIANATKEELEQYIDLVDEITSKLELIDVVEENNNK